MVFIYMHICLHSVCVYMFMHIPDMHICIYVGKHTTVISIEFYHASIYVYRCLCLLGISLYKSFIAVMSYSSYNVCLIMYFMYQLSIVLCILIYIQCINTFSILNVFIHCMYISIHNTMLS